MLYSSQRFILLFTIFFLLYSISFSGEKVEELVKQGKSLVSQMNFEEALKYFDRALEIEPENIEALDCRGLTLYHLKKYEEAIVCYDKILTINQKCSCAWCDKGKALEALERYDEAIECFDTTVKLDPNDPFAEKFKEEVLKKKKDK
jgi:tetratricopeptide (TPR) repeat protein